MLRYVTERGSVAQVSCCPSAAGMKAHHWCDGAGLRATECNRNLGAFSLLFDGLCCS